MCCLVYSIYPTLQDAGDPLDLEQKAPDERDEGIAHDELVQRSLEPLVDDAPASSEEASLGVVDEEDDDPLHLPLSDPSSVALSALLQVSFFFDF